MGQICGDVLREQATDDDRGLKQGTVQAQGDRVGEPAGGTRQSKGRLTPPQAIPDGKTVRWGGHLVLYRLPPFDPQHPIWSPSAEPGVDAKTKQNPTTKIANSSSGPDRTGHGTSLASSMPSTLCGPLSPTRRQTQELSET